MGNFGQNILIGKSAETNCQRCVPRERMRIENVQKVEERKERKRGLNGLDGIRTSSRDVYGTTMQQRYLRSQNQPLTQLLLLPLRCTLLTSPHRAFNAPSSRRCDLRFPLLPTALRLMQRGRKEGPFVSWMWSSVYDINKVFNKVFKILIRSDRESSRYSAFGSAL